MLEDGVRSPGTEVTGSYGIPGFYASNQTLDLCKSNTNSYLMSHLSRPKSKTSRLAGRTL